MEARGFGVGEDADNFFIREMKKVVFDKVRKKYVAMLPEEEVRQKMIDFLIEEKKFPASLISVERKIRDHKNIKNLRTDIVVYDKDCQTPLILVECKAPYIEIKEANLKQLIEYNFFVNARFLVLTNGKKIFCLEHSDNKYRQTSIPSFDEVDKNS